MHVPRAFESILAPYFHVVVLIESRRPRCDSPLDWCAPPGVFSSFCYLSVYYNASL